MIDSENFSRSCESRPWAHGRSMNQLLLDSPAHAYETAAGASLGRS